MYAYSPYSDASLNNYINIAASIESYVLVGQSADSASAPNGYLMADEIADNRWGDYSRAIAYNMNDLCYPYSYYNTWALAYADTDTTLAAQSCYNYGYPSYVFTEASLDHYYINDWDYSYGNSVLSQIAYTDWPSYVEYAFNY